MALLPQNIRQRAERLGRSVDDVVTNAAQDLRQSANIAIDGVASAVEGAAQDLVSTAMNPLQSVANALPGALTSLTGGFLSNIFGGLGLPPYKNQLEGFASYNYLFTLGCLNNLEINFPELTYRRRDPFVIIAKSGGGAGARKVTTPYERPGRVEYYIEDVQIDSLVVANPRTRHTNAFSFTFKVIEPYSMGQFLQTLQRAALRAGHKNYLRAPFSLSIDFKGWDDNGNPGYVPMSRRVFALSLVNVTFKVTEAGSEYEVQAIPWHEQGFADEIQSTQTDTSLIGRSVSELLQTGGSSLSTIINTRLLEGEEAGQTSTADQYLFVFPKSRVSATQLVAGGAEQEDDEGATDQSAGGDESNPNQRELSEERKQQIYESITGIQNGTMPADFDAYLSQLLGIVVKRSNIGESIREYAEDEENMNEIGTSRIVQSFLDGGEQPFGRPRLSEVEGQPGVFRRGNVTISDEGRTLTFGSGSRIQEIIEEIILVSEYGRKIATEEPDANGMMNWFKIEVDVFNVTDSTQVDRSGDVPKVYVYRIMPYKVNASRFMSPSRPTPGISNLTRQAVKEYNYYYTGENKDVIEFDIDIQAAFFTALGADYGQLSADSVQGPTNQLTAGNPDTVYQANEGSGDTISSSGSRQTRNVSETSSGNSGGGAQEHPETRIARDFNDAIVNSETDLAVMQMTIWGDPYYLMDSGIGNYHAQESFLMNINSDGAMDYQNGEVDILVNFRTPIDIGDDGYMRFPGGGFVPVGQFSGLYNVTQCTSYFQQGKFTQELQMLRRPNQEIDIKVEGVPGGNAAVVPADGEAAISPNNSTPAGSSGSSEGGTGGASGTTNTGGSGATASGDQGDGLRG